MCKTNNSGASAFGNPSLPQDWALRCLQETCSVTALGVESGSGEGGALFPPPHSGCFLGSISKASPVLRGTAWTHLMGRRGDDRPPQAALPSPGAACRRPSVARPSPFLRCQPQDPTAETCRREDAEHLPPSDRLPELPLPAPPGRNLLSGQE